MKIIESNYAYHIRSSVRLGEHDLSTDAEAQHVDLPVTNIIQYPNYDKKDGTGDLAILVLGEDIAFSRESKAERFVECKWLEQTLTLSDTISPICLPINEPENSKNFVRLNPFVAGKYFQIFIDFKFLTSFLHFRLG